VGDRLIFLGCDDILVDSLDKIAIRLVDMSTVYYGKVIFRSTGPPYGGRFSKYRLMQANIALSA
jgi:hypothetical protein